MSVRISGTYYQAGSSRAHEVQLVFHEDGHLTLLSQGLAQTLNLAEIKISEPLGKMPRHIEIPDGGRIEVSDLDALEKWECALGKGTSGMHWVNFLESKWRWVALFLVFLLGFLAAGYLWALPFIAKHVAHRLPTQAAEFVTNQARDAFELLFDLGDTQLPLEKQETLKKEFLRMAKEIDPKSPRNYRLEFFEATMPNAFALPDGLVCMTDELVTLAKNDKEIYAVLAHEIIHVREQHGMRSVLQNSAVFLIWTLMTGDVSTLAGMGSALPAMIAQSGYSRGFEQEADQGAADYLMKRGWGVEPLCEILERIDPEMPQLTKATELISTHPLTIKRLRDLREIAGKMAQPSEKPPAEPVPKPKPK